MAFHDLQSDSSIMRIKAALVYHPTKYIAHDNKSCMDELCGNNSIRIYSILNQGTK